MKLKYVGPHDEVEIPSLGLTCRRLGTVEVVGEAAQNLREQECWEWVKPAAKSATEPESMTEERGEDVG